jgi:hypothetical protein
VVLKNEWERVKKGELLFRIITWAAVALVLRSVVALFLAAAIAPAISSAIASIR